MPPDRVELSPDLLLEAIGDDWPPEQVEAVLELLAASDGKFPAGSRRLPAELVRAVQRERLIASMLDAAATRGYREANVQDVIERAGVSRPTFYEHFTNKDDCFLAAFDAGARRLRSRITTAAAGGEGWRVRLRLSLTAVLAFGVAEPHTARTLIVEARAAGPEATRRRINLLDDLARCLDASADALLPGRRSRSALTAASVVGGVESVLYARLCREDCGDLEDLLPSLMYFAVLPYEGHAAASEELGPPSG
ncbi:MAG: TetR/AcrR family transcriptional regulator [Actinobacteria bacterium]|nr:TetR/AcrR family transcriptional regulator [Actinomycetota bacterium]